MENANKILDQAQQPYDFLIATVRNKDAQLKKVHDTIEQLEKQLRSFFFFFFFVLKIHIFQYRECENERQSLIKTNNQLTKDIEKLLEYQEVVFFDRSSVKTKKNRKIDCLAIESNEKCCYEFTTSRSAKTSSSFTISNIK